MKTTEFAASLGTKFAWLACNSYGHTLFFISELSLLCPQGLLLCGDETFQKFQVALSLRICLFVAPWWQLAVYYNACDGFDAFVSGALVLDNAAYDTIRFGCHVAFDFGGALLHEVGP